MRPYLEPLRRSVTVAGTPEKVFELFTRDFGRWWPLRAPYSVFGDAAASCGMQTKVGGDLYEISTAGQRSVWGHITRFDPPAKLQFTWFPGRAEETQQIVEVTFTPTDAGQTRVDLEHRNWQTLGDQAAAIRSGYERGWNAVLDHFADAARTRPVNDVAQPR
jgi:uncharacterized protein YndB with AHSA1/START domain